LRLCCHGVWDPHRSKATAWCLNKPMLCALYAPMPCCMPCRHQLGLNPQQYISLANERGELIATSEALGLPDGTMLFLGNDSPPPSPPGSDMDMEEGEPPSPPTSLSPDDDGYHPHDGYLPGEDASTTRPDQTRPDRTGPDPEERTSRRRGAVVSAHPKLRSAALRCVCR
jgi:hypothetical protein